MRSAKDGPGSNPLDEMSLEFVEVREWPKGTELVAITDGRVVLRFKAAIRFWWQLPYALLALTVVGSLPLGIFLGTYLNPFYLVTDDGQAFFSAALWLTPVVMILITIISFHITQPWVTVVSTPRYVSIGSLVFDATRYEGLRTGYEITLNHGVLKNDFHDLSIGLQGLRASYGPWGEDLPYLINQYHAPLMVLWMNMHIDAGRKPRQSSAAAAPEQKF